MCTVVTMVGWPGRVWFRRALSILGALVVGSGVLAGTMASAPGVGATPVTYTDWPMFLQNPARSNATTDPNLSVANASLLKLKWTYKAGATIAASTSVVGTTAYVGAWNGYEYALDTAT